MLFADAQWMKAGTVGMTMHSDNAMNRFLASVERRALRMAEFSVRDRDEALDIVQDSMMALVQKYANRPEAEWAPLFFRILNSRIISWHRRRQSRRRWLWFGNELQTTADDDTDGLPEAEDRQTPDAWLQAHSLRERLEAVLKQLPLRQRQVFLLRAWEGLDVKATAQAMGCSEGSVKTHYFRVMARLREVLGEDLS